MNQPKNNKWGAHKGVHVVKKTMWESTVILLGNVKFLSIGLVYLSVLLVLFYGFYIFNLWYIKQDELQEKEKRKQIVNERRRQRKIEKERL